MEKAIKNLSVKYILAIVIIIISTFVCSSEAIIEKPTKIKIAASSNWKPFSYLNQRGEPDGVLIDFWKAWGKQNEVDIEFIMTSWANTLELVKNGEADIHSGLFYNDDRAQYMDFGKSFIDIMTGIFIKEDMKAWDINDIKDIGIGVTKGNNAKYYLQKNYPDVKLLIYPNNKEIMKAVKDGEVKAIVMDYHSSLRNISLAYPELKDFKILQTIYTQPLRVGVKKGETELLAFVDDGIKKMPVDELNKVQSKWKYITIHITRASALKYVLAASIMIIILLLINILFLRYRIKLNIKRLMESEESYKKLVELYPDGLFVQCDDKIVFVNEAIVNILGEKSIDNMINKDFLEYIHSSCKESIRKKFDMVQRTKIVVQASEEKIVRFNGEVIDVEVSVNAITYRGKPAILAIIRDISERKREEEKRRKIVQEKERLLKEKLEYEKLKIDFFSNISHEFRTPLNIILGTIQLINKIHDEEAICQSNSPLNKYLKIMKQNCYRLIRLVNNLLDITKLDLGHMQMEFVNHNIVEVVENITQSIAEYIKSKDINIIFDTDTEEKIISCDADKIERVMLNLLSNAVKFTKPGGNIYVNMYDKHEKIIISVKDTGAGIPKEKQEIIFERFRQAHPLLNRQNEGSGIGLSLVKSIVELHGGKIYLNSQYTNGSEFIIELPASEKTQENFISSDKNIHSHDKVELIDIEFSDIYS